MIKSGDKVAVGVSGGKDSLTLLTALANLREYYPESFELNAITLTTGIGEFNTEPIRELCNRLNVPLTIEETLIGKIVFEVRKEENPCSMCANLRRGALNNTALCLGCNKVALGHNCDDLIETFLLSLYYEGRLHTFSPVTHLKRTNITLIRPLSYVWEKDIKGFINKYKIETVPSPCPVAGKTTRHDVKKLIADMAKHNKNIKGNILGAIKRGGIDGWRES
ncbi:MAG: tRNA 2-thiocytidine biosynthesis TtcA family protein [Eubacteriales bacterium]|nr:tRNA 2-thiocytidine biosynthesis TtcA family protein [Eubacteriales bacterium]